MSGANRSPPRWAQRTEHAAALRAAALAAVDPAAAVERALTRAGEHTGEYTDEHGDEHGGQREGERLRVAGREYSLAGRRCWLVAAGKAAGPMLAAARAILGPQVAGLAGVTRRGQRRADDPAELREGGHPLPDQGSLAATCDILALIERAAPGDLVIALLSGGASALLARPAEGVTLAELQALTEALLRSGASIDEINAVRKHLDDVKGGGLARLAGARGAELLALILSDVVGDPLDVIASGPTAPDRSTYADAQAVLARYDLAAAGPAARLAAGTRGERPETPKPGDALFDRVHNVIVGSNRLAAEAAAEAARGLGFEALVLTTFLQGEAREVGRVAAALAREMAGHGRPVAPPGCLVLGGETTVTLSGRGRGGRNQELALAAALALDGLAGVQLMTLATDGSDGPTDAAGALVTGETVARAAALGLDPRAALAANDAYSFFERSGELIKTGPTNTNVNDLLVIMAYTPDESDGRG